jgi:hypothetical protein
MQAIRERVGDILERIQQRNLQISGMPEAEKEALTLRQSNGDESGEDIETVPETTDGMQATREARAREAQAREVQAREVQANRASEGEQS